MSSCHREVFLTVQHDSRPNVCQQLHQSIDKVVIMMGKQKIPITGHVPEESNLHAIPSLTAQQNASLRNHLGRARTQSKIHKSRNTLQQLSDGCNLKDRRLYASILKWDFIITSAVLQHIFCYTHRLTVHLQVSFTPN